MRLFEYLKRYIEEEGEVGSGTGPVGPGTMTGNIAQYPTRLPFNTRRRPFLSKKKKKKVIPA